MRKDITGKSFLFPMPVLILAAYDEEGKPQCMNAAWGAVSGMTQVSICVGPRHKTVKAIRSTGAFTVSIGDADHEIQCDYVGVVSGNDEPDKFAKAGFHAVPSEKVNAPIIEELKMALECEVVSYDEDSHILIGKVVNISVDEVALDKDGNIDVRLLDPIIYDSPNKNYYRFGECIGKAYSDGHKLENSTLEELQKEKKKAEKKHGFIGSLIEKIDEATEDMVVPEHIGIVEPLKKLADEIDEATEDMMVPEHIGIVEPLKDLAGKIDEATEDMVVPEHIGIVEPLKKLADEIDEATDSMITPKE